MAAPVDLYNILRSYANRVRNPQFTVKEFVVFLAKYAHQFQGKYPELEQWVENTERRVTDALPDLVREHGIQLGANEEGRSVTIPRYCVDSIRAAWKRNEESPELPFPDESSLGYSIPHTSLRILSIDMDFLNYLHNPQRDILPILKIGFPEGYGSMIALAESLPKKLLDMTLLKIRQYLRSHNNRDYLQHKLQSAFPGKENQLKDTLNMLMSRPFDAVSEIEHAGDFSFLFWSYLISMVKADIRKKNDLLAEDYAVVQAVYIVEAINNWYKSTVQKKKEVELALKNLDLAFDKAPLLFTLEDILRFNDSKGIPLLGQYTREDLDQWMAERTSAADRDSLPELLSLHDPAGKLVYIKKSKILPLSARLISEARPKVKASMTKHWYKLVKEYRREPAMDEDEMFNRALARQVSHETPLLNTLLESNYLYLAYLEVEMNQVIPEASRIYKNGVLIPMSELLLLQRKKLLTDVHMLLPFWYSTPILSAIISFFARLGKKRKQSEEISEKEDHADDTTRGPTSRQRREELRRLAKRAEAEFVPKGKSLELCMDEYLALWNRNLNPQARENLTEDVQALTRDYLRKTMRYLKTEAFTPDRIRALANTLCDGPSLQKIPNRDALQSYLELYMIQLVLKD